MKKLLVFSLVFVMIVGMSFNALADGGFLTSPSKNNAPIIIEFETSYDDCAGKLIVTPYNKRDELPINLLKLIEEAYGIISETDDLTTLNAKLKEVADKRDIEGENLAVSDLFDIRLEGCDKHEEHYNLQVTISADTLDNFVGLLHYTSDREWVLVENAEVINDGKYLRFTVDSLSPFAIVVDTSKVDPDAPKPGDDSNILVFTIIMVVSALGLIAILLKTKKQKNY